MARRGHFDLSAGDRLEGLVCSLPSGVWAGSPFVHGRDAVAAESVCHFSAFVKK